MGHHSQPDRIVTLDLQNNNGTGDVPPADVVRADLSACAAIGACLWLACDETTTVERLISDDGIHFASRRSFDLGQTFALPDGSGEEIDIEGLAHDDGYLWITGSHSLRRRKPKHHEVDRAAALERLSTVKADANRYLIARVPLIPTADPGVHDLKGGDAATPPDGKTAACLPMTDGTNALIQALANDEHLASFLTIPSKENGIDIEGIAVRGDRIFVGLRGPVLRGWAIIIELSVHELGSGALALTAIGAGGEPYRKHFLDLDGLGVRDLIADGDDLLILSGPTMDLSGPVRIWRWPNAMSPETNDVVIRDDLRHVLDVPFGDGVDHAEGIALVGDGLDEAKELLIIYDSPAPWRLRGDGASIYADVFVMTS